MASFRLLLFFLLVFPAAAKAQTEPKLTPADVQKVLKAYQEKVRDEAEAENKGLRESQELALEVGAATMGEEWLQYVMPSIYESEAASSRLLNDPRFRKYKDQKPTRVSPYMKRAVDLYMDFLSPDFYVFFIPEAFPDITGYKEKLTLKDINRPAPRIIIVSDKMIPEEAVDMGSARSTQTELALASLPFDFAKEGKTNILPVIETRSARITADSEITDADIGAFAGTMRKLRKIPRSAMPEKDGKTLSLPEDFCPRFQEALKKSGRTADFDAAAKESGFDETSWLNMCIRAARAVFFMQFDQDALMPFFMNRLSRKPEELQNLYAADQRAMMRKQREFLMTYFDRMVFNETDFMRFYPYRTKVMGALYVIPGFTVDYDDGE